MAKRPLRIQRVDDIFVCSNRCHDNEHLIPTDPISMSRILGAMARYSMQRSVDIYAYSFLPNGFWLILSAPEADRQNFMRDFQSWVARMANRLYDRSGSFFHERYAAEAILDAQKLVETYVDVLVAPVREGFARSLEAFSSITSWHALKTGRAPIGEWVDRDKLRSLRRSNPDLSEEEFAKEYVVELASPPLEDAEADVDEEGVASWLLEKVDERIEEILKWQEEQEEEQQEEAARSWRRAKPHPRPWSARPVEPIGPPKYRYSRVCRTDSQKLRERYHEMRKEMRLDYSEAMAFWREGKKAFCKGRGGKGKRVRRRGFKDGQEGGRRCREVNFPTSSIPPGWTKTRRPLRNRRPTPPQNRPPTVA